MGLWPMDFDHCFQKSALDLADQTGHNEKQKSGLFQVQNPLGLAFERAGISLAVKKGSFRNDKYLDNDGHFWNRFNCLFDSGCLARP